MTGDIPEIGICRSGLNQGEIRYAVGEAVGVILCELLIKRGLIHLLHQHGFHETHRLVAEGKSPINAACVNLIQNRIPAQRNGNAGSRSRREEHLNLVSVVAQTGELVCKTAAGNRKEVRNP